MKNNNVSWIIFGAAKMYRRRCQKNKMFAPSVFIFCCLCVIMFGTGFQNIWFPAILIMIILMACTFFFGILYLISLIKGFETETQKEFLLQMSKARAERHDNEAKLINIIKGNAELEIDSVRANTRQVEDDAAKAELVLNTFFTDTTEVAEVAS